MKESPKWTMTSRKFYTHTEVTPGPGAYSLSSTLTGPNFKIGNSSREPIGSLNGNPGPGSYSPKKFLPFLGNTLYSLISMPTSARVDIAKSLNVPGPGQYNAMFKNNAPSYSLRGRMKTQSFDGQPGPGLYNPLYENSFEKTPSFKLGTSKRVTIESNSNSPGPGKYELRNSMGGPNWGFGSGSRSMVYENNIPGPGSYQAKPHMKSYSYSMTPRRPLIDNVEKTPGPGTYSSHITEGSPRFTISKSPRKGIAEDSLSPGPGAYSPDIPKSSPKNAFGTAARNTLDKPKSTPGPGKYNPVSLEKSPSYSLRSRPVEKQVEKAPGPGKYNPNTDYVLESSPSASLPKSAKGVDKELEKKMKLVPGPGTYGNFSTLAGPKWGFGSSNRSGDKDKNVPGPGAYN